MGIEEQAPQLMLEPEVGEGVQAPRIWIQYVSILFAPFWYWTLVPYNQTLIMLIFRQVSVCAGQNVEGYFVKDGCCKKVRRRFRKMLQ